MKTGEYVIRWKGTDVFFSSGSYHAPKFSSLFDAWPYATVEAARDAAKHMRIGNASEVVLQIVRLPELPDIFEPEHGIAPELVQVIEILADLDDGPRCPVYATNEHLKTLRRTISDAKIALMQQAIAVGAALAGEDVVNELVAQSAPPPTPSHWAGPGTPWP